MSEPADKDVVLKRLAWLQPCCRDLNLLLDDIVVSASIQDTGDPLARVVWLTLSRPVHDDIREAVRVFIRARAQELDCAIPRILIEKLSIRLHVMLKYRYARK